MTNDRRGEKAALVVLFKKRKGKKFFFLLFTFISQSNLASLNALFGFPASCSPIVRAFHAGRQTQDGLVVTLITRWDTY